MTLKTMLQRYVEFQDQVIRRRTQFDLKKARERAHILEGLKRAVDIVDEVIYAIRHCGGGQAEAKVAIMEQFGFDDVQADAICKFPCLLYTSGCSPVTASAWVASASFRARTALRCWPWLPYTCLLYTSPSFPCGARC